MDSEVYNCALLLTCCYSILKMPFCPENHAILFTILLPEFYTNLYQFLVYSLVVKHVLSIFSIPHSDGRNYHDVESSQCELNVLHKDTTEHRGFWLPVGLELTTRG